MAAPRRTVRITLEVLGVSDRDGWEWGEGIARALAAELNETGNAVFGPIAVDCMDVEIVQEVQRPPSTREP